MLGVGQDESYINAGKRIVPLGDWACTILQVLAGQR